MLPRRAAHDGDLFPVYVEIRDAVHVALCPDEQAQPCAHVRIGKFDIAPAFLRRGHGRDDHINPSCLKRDDEPAERHVFQLDLALEMFAERTREIHAHARGFAFSVAHLERRIAHVHADAQRLRPGFFARGKNETRQQEEEQSG